MVLLFLNLDSNILSLTVFDSHTERIVKLLEHVLGGLLVGGD